MIRIYDKEVSTFETLGLGSLDEAQTAIVIEELNGLYEMEMEYPISGRHYDKIELRNIIFCKPNPFSDGQPFRIFSITKPIDGIITVKAEHISYDASGVIVLPKRDENNDVVSFGEKVENVELELEGYYLDTVISDINNAAVLDEKNPFTILKHSSKENVFKENGYSIPSPTNLRSILGGSEESILEIYKGELIFDKYNIHLYDKRGEERGISIRYGKNMTDLEQETDSTSLFTAIFPFYSKKYTESYTKPTLGFQYGYIVPDSIPYTVGWLSTTIQDHDGLTGFAPIIPVIEQVQVWVDGVKEIVAMYVPIQIKTVGEFENRVFRWRKATREVEEGDTPSLVDVYDITVDSGKITVMKDEAGVVITPSIRVIYHILDIDYVEDPAFYEKNFIYIEDESGSGGQIESYEGEGFYLEVYDARTAEHKDELGIILPTYPIKYDEVASDWVPDYEEGKIYVRARYPRMETISEDKYVYLDLISYPELIDVYDITVVGGEITEMWDEEGVVITPSVGFVYRILDIDYVEDPEFYEQNFVYVPEEEGSGGQIVSYEGPVNDLLENGIFYINDALKALEVQRVLALDLTDALDEIENLQPEQVTQEMIFNKAEQYLTEHNLAKIQDSVKFSFVNMSDQLEYAHLKALEIVKLGDEVDVVYESLGINSKHRVISTEYNVLTDSYNEVEVGDKVGVISNNVVVSGDKVSSLSNDAEYTDKKYITNFVTENATIFNADILNAVIANLEAGTIKVTGHIEALSGEIGGCKLEDGKLILSTEIRLENDTGDIQFHVDSEGNVEANSISLESSDPSGPAVTIRDGVLTTVGAKIDAEYVVSPHITTNKLTLKGIVDIEVDEIEGDYDEQTVTFTSEIVMLTQAGDVRELWIYITPNDERVLWHDQTLSVQYRYSRSDDPSKVRSKTGIFVLSDSNYNSGTERYEVFTGEYVLAESGWHFINFSIDSTNPDETVGWTEADGVAGSTALKINSNLVPDDFNNRDLGSADKPWRRIYSVKVNTYPPTNTVTSNYTLVSDDDGSVILAGTAVYSVKITVPNNSLVDFPINTEIAIVKHGTGDLTIGAATGVTLEGEPPATTFEITDSVAIKKIDTNVWIMVGAFEEVV